MVQPDGTHQYDDSRELRVLAARRGSVLRRRRGALWPPRGPAAATARREAVRMSQTCRKTAAESSTMSRSKGLRGSRPSLRLATNTRCVRKPAQCTHAVTAVFSRGPPCVLSTHRCRRREICNRATAPSATGRSHPQHPGAGRQMRPRHIGTTGSQTFPYSGPTALPPRPTPPESRSAAARARRASPRRTRRRTRGRGALAYIHIGAPAGFGQEGRHYEI
jgi:hypothetical protein